MSRLTLRLPETLHKQLEELASQEAVSLNQYIVYALTRQTTLAYAAQATSKSVQAQQQAAYATLLERLGTATPEAVAAVLAERDVVEPSAGLTPEIVQAIKERLRHAA